MITICSTCHLRYDDALCWTICPHERFISDEDAARKDLACSLFGKKLRFNHMASGALEVQAIDYKGMVTIKGMSGEFAPHLFKVVENEKPSES